MFRLRFQAQREDHIAAGEPIELEVFEEVYLKPYIVSAQQYKEECKLTFDHTAPAPSSTMGGGSAVQGL